MKKAFFKNKIYAKKLSFQKSFAFTLRNILLNKKQRKISKPPKNVMDVKDTICSFKNKKLVLQLI